MAYMSWPFCAAKAWLQNYLGGLSELRRGVLRQAVVLQIKNGATSLLLDVEGINGMVPNQEMTSGFRCEEFEISWYDPYCFFMFIDLEPMISMKFFLSKLRGFGEQLLRLCSGARSSDWTAPMSVC